MPRRLALAGRSLLAVVAVGCAAWAGVIALLVWWASK